jgi:hypothetical protein
LVGNLTIVTSTRWFQRMKVVLVCRVVKFEDPMSCCLTSSLRYDDGVRLKARALKTVEMSSIRTVRYFYSGLLVKVTARSTRNRG